jgi:hypothetical protein
VVLGERVAEDAAAPLCLLASLRQRRGLRRGRRDKAKASVLLLALSQARKGRGGQVAQGALAELPANVAPAIPGHAPSPKAVAKAEADGLKEVPNWTLKLTAASPITFSVPPSKLLAKPALDANALSFRDGTTVTGKIIEIDGGTESSTLDIPIPDF